MLILTLAIALVGTLSIRLIYDKPLEGYTTGFHLNAIDLEKSGTYIDGSKFDYRDIISFKKINKAKATSDEFNGVDTSLLISKGAINISKLDVYDKEKMDAEKIAEIKKSYFQITLKNQQLEALKWQEIILML